MHDPASIIAQLQSFLKQPGQGVSEQTIVSAARFAQLCKDANARLERCAEHLRQGQRVEAAQLAQAAPALVPLCQLLDFPGRAQWDKVASARKLPAPPQLNQELVQAAAQAVMDSKLQARLSTVPAHDGKTRAEATPAVTASSAPLNSLTPPMQHRVTKPALVVIALLVLLVSGVLGGGGAYLGWQALRADKTPTPEEILAKISTTPRSVAPASTPSKPTAPVASIQTPVIAEPVVKVSEPPTAIQPPKKETPVVQADSSEPTAPPAPSPVNPPPAAKLRDTHVKRHFSLPSRSNDMVREEQLKDVGEVSRLQLVGLDEVADKIPKSQRRLKQVFQESGTTLRVNLEGSGGEPITIGSFHLSKGKLSFRWSYKANADAEGRSASELVRDCVLEVTNTLGEPTYFSFRPVEPIRGIVFEPPTIALDTRTHAMSDPLECGLTSRPIAIPNAPLRPLHLEFDAGRTPIVRNASQEIRLLKGVAAADEFVLEVESAGNNHLAWSGAATTCYYQRFRLRNEISSSPFALTGMVTLRFEPRIETAPALDRKRTNLGDEYRRQDAELARKQTETFSTTTKASLQQTRTSLAATHTADLAKVDADLRKWKQEELDLRHRLKPVVTLPAGTIWMKVADLRVDVYRIVDR